MPVAGSAPVLKKRFFYILLTLVFIFAFVIILFQCHDLVDDAYISARYAKNLAQGQGLVYNRIKGAERVEGYSNFLWVLAIFCGLKLGASPKITTQFLGILCALLSLGLVFLLIKNLTKDRWLALLGVLFISLNIYFAIWQVEGLETPLFGILILATIYSLAKNKNRLAMVFALLCALCRPDGILLFFAIALVQFLKRKSLALRVNYLTRIWLWFIVPYLCYFVWRAIYYKSLFPNTFYAKTGLGWIALREGAIYFKDLFLAQPAMIFLFILALASVFQVKKFSLWIQVLIVYLFSYLIFIFAVGGDWMPGFRFFIPLLSLFVIIGAIILKNWEEKAKNRAKFSKTYLYLFFTFLCALNLIGLIRYCAKDSPEKNWHRNQSKFYLPTALWLKKYVWQSQSIALGDIGYIGYFGDHDRIIDTMGLVDRHLGRLKGISSMTTDLDYIFSQKPFCIVSLIHRYPDGTIIGHSQFDREVAKDPRLAQNYRLVKEIYGWRSVEISREDWQKRESEVFFRIYFRKSL